MDTTYEYNALISQELADYGFKVSVMPRNTPSDAPRWAESCNAWRVKITYEGRAMVINYYTGYGIPGTPSVADVISCVSGDYFMARDYLNIDEYHRDMGGDSISETIKAYKTLIRQSRAYERVLGSPTAIDDVALMVEFY